MGSASRAPQEVEPTPVEGGEKGRRDALQVPSIRRLFTNASIYGIGRALTSLVSFFTDPILSHLLTRADFGLLGLTRTTTGLLTSAYKLGLDGATNRIYYDVENDEAAKRRAVGTINTFLVIWVLLLSIGQEVFGPMIYARAFDNLPYAPYGRFVAYALACETLMAVAQMVWSAQERAKLLTSMRLTMTFLTLAITFGLLLGTKLGVLSVYIAQAVGPTLLLWVHLRFAWKSFGFAWDSRTIQRALAFGLPMVVHLSSHWALEAADRLMLEHYMGREAVGVYTVAYGSMTTLMMVNNSINSAYVPQFIRSRGKPGGEEFIARAVTYFWLSILTATLGFVIFAPLVIRTLYSSRFAAAAPLSPLLALGAPLHAVYLVYINSLFHANKTRMIPVLTLTAGILNVGLNVLLITRMGLLGAVLATVAGYALLALLFRILASAIAQPIPLEKGRLLRVVIVFSAVVIPAYLLDGRFSIPVEVGLKVILALLAPLLLYVSRFATAEELATVRERLSSIGHKANS